MLARLFFGGPSLAVVGLGSGSTPLGKSLQLPQQLGEGADVSESWAKFKQPACDPLETGLTGKQKVATFAETCSIQSWPELGFQTKFGGNR